MILKLKTIPRKYILFAVMCILTPPALLNAQSTAVEIETLLETKAVTYAQAARFVLEAADARITSDPEEAFNFAVQRKWLSKKVSSGDPARLDRISLLLMRSFDVKGGIFYSMTKAPHYAYRELVYKSVIQGNHDPSMQVSGERLLFYVNRILAMYDGSPAEVRRRERRLAEEEAARQRREALAASITEIIVEQAIADTKVEATETGVTITLSNINFSADSWELPVAEMGKLQELARVLERVPNIKLQIAGHTTRIGTQEYLHTLSTNRAQSVADYLVSLGAVKAANISIIGYGADRLLIEGTSAAALAANRRVEINILED